MRRCRMSDPVPLVEAILTRPFVYCRAYGVFYVPRAWHQIAMSLLLAWQHGLNDGIDVSDNLSLEYAGESSEYWLEVTPGSAFRSSAGIGNVIACRNENLNSHEKRWLKDIYYLEGNTLSFVGA